MSQTSRADHLGPESKVCEHCGAQFFRDKRCTWAHWGRARFCSRQCVGAVKSSTAAANRPDIRVAFERNFERGPGCWEWTGLKDKDGYGLFSYARKSRRANRMALAFDGREPPAGMMACHHCDNPGCVNPAHLYVGSDADNTRDKVARGRTPVGERGYQAKLKDADIAAIRGSTDRVGVLADRYGVTHSNIVLIRQRKTWKHLP